MAGWGTNASWDPRVAAYNDPFGSQANAMRNDAAIRASLMQQMRSGAGGNADLAAQNWQNTLRNTEGRGDAVMSDPFTQAALDRFKGVLSGSDVPYTNAVQSQLLARQADAGASAMGAQREMLANQVGALGGSLADPSAQAALRNLLAQNRAQNNANLGDMQTKATLANFGARNDAASSLANVRAGQLGMANGQYNLAANLYDNRNFGGGHVNAAGQPQAQPYGQQPVYYNSQTQGTGYAPAGNQPQVQPRPQPAQTTAYGDYSNSATPSNRYQGPAAPGPYGQSTAPAQPAYVNNVNQATGVAKGTGYVQMAGQPNTRQYMNTYNPNARIY